MNYLKNFIWAAIIFYLCSLFANAQELNDNSSIFLSENEINKIELEYDKKFAELDLKKDNLKRISNIEGKISFKKVYFEYKKDNQVLRNINLEIKKGQVTAFVGASGAGKSTMMALILKFITPNSGDIFIDDKNLKLLNTKDIRKNIALVQQQPFLFSGKLLM